MRSVNKTEVLVEMDSATFLPVVLAISAYQSSMAAVVVVVAVLAIAQVQVEVEAEAEAEAEA